MSSGRRTNAKDTKVKQKETSMAKVAKMEEDCLPSLVEINNEHNVVSETGQTVSGWHHNDESKHIIDECVERL